MRLRILLGTCLVVAATMLTPQALASTSLPAAHTGEFGLGSLPHPMGRPSVDTADCGASGSSIWAGNIACDPRGTYSDAFVEFTIPRTTTSGTVGFWVGVGGGAYTSGERVLVQAGVQVIYGQSPTAWWEVISSNGYNNGPNTICTLHIGDKVQVEVESNFDGSGVNAVFFLDETDNSRCDYNRNESGTPLSDSGTAECVTEYPSGVTLREDFGSVTFDSCDPGTNSGSKGIGDYPHYYSSIRNGSCTQVSVGPISSGENFTDTYHSC
jgi:Peptidase A4 family